MADNQVTSEAEASSKGFWVRYLKEHQDPANCVPHAVGTILPWIVLGIALFYSNWLLLLMPLFGYGFAWFGHYFVEHNKPLSAQYSVRSLLADFRLTACILLGKRPK